MIHVIATIAVKPGQRAAFIEAFHKLVPQVLAEDGCIAYGPTVDVPSGIGAQQMTGENAAVIIEQWESVEHLQAHLDAPHMHAFRESAGHLIESITLLVTQPV